MVMELFQMSVVYPDTLLITIALQAVIIREVNFYYKIHKAAEDFVSLNTCVAGRR